MPGTATPAGTRTPAQKAAATRAANKAKAAAGTAAPAPAPKSSPVRKDVTPAQVTPDVTELETEAQNALSALITDADTLAGVLAKLYALSPWDTEKVSPADYAAKIGIRAGVLPEAQRQRLVMSIHAATPKLKVLAVAALTGASEPTIQRDRRDLGIASANRSAGTAAGIAASKPAPAPKPAAGPVTKMVPVLSMTSVREFINGLDDADMLAELADLITERLVDLA